MIRNGSICCGLDIMRGELRVVMRDCSAETFGTRSLRDALHLEPQHHRDVTCIATAGTTSTPKTIRAPNKRVLRLSLALLRGQSVQTDVLGTPGCSQTSFSGSVKPFISKPKNVNIPTQNMTSSSQNTPSYASADHDVGDAMTEDCPFPRRPLL